MEEQKSVFKKIFRIDNIFLAYIALKPIYLFESGLPQLSDILLIICFGLLFFKLQKESELSERIRKWITLFVIAIIYQASIQFIYLFLTSKAEFLFELFYYVFNLISSVMFILVFHKYPLERIRNTILNGCFFSCIIIDIGLIVKQNSELRQTSFFNNPNQLGYFCLLILTATLFLSPNSLSKFKSLTIHVSILVATILSYSKAAVIGIFLTYLSHFSFKLNFRNPIHSFGYVLFVILIVYFSIDFINNDDSLLAQNEIMGNLRDRITNVVDENDSNLYDGRGYGRVYEILPHIIWGVGEGGYDRFRIMNGLEIHSTIVSLLVSYGAIGLLLYIALFFKVMNTSFFSTGIKDFFLLSGIAFYSLSHNGVRNTFLWIILSMILIFNDRISRGNELSSKPLDDVCHDDMETSNRTVTD